MMATEKRLIDANLLGRDSFHIKQWGKGIRCVVDWDDIEAAPTVDAVILPCKVRDSVWLIQWWNCFVVEKLSRPIQRTVLHYDIRSDGLYAHFHDGCINTKYFGELVFLTREEAEAAFAKMNGGNNETD